MDTNNTAEAAVCAHGVKEWTPAARIIILFGDVNKMAEELDVPSSTVAGWKARHKIPPKYYPDIIKKAPQLSGGRAFTVAYGDFFEFPKAV